MNSLNDLDLIPIATIALEIGTTVDELARLADDVTIDAVSGLRSVTAEQSRRLLTAHRDAVRADADRARAQREAAARQPNPLRARIRALRRQQEWFDGVDLPAAGRMMAGTYEGRLDNAGARLDEMMTSGADTLTYHSLRDEKG